MYERAIAEKPFRSALRKAKGAENANVCMQDAYARQAEELAYHRAMDLAKEVQALLDRRVRFAIQAYGSRYVIKVGDYLEGLGTQATAITLEEAVAWVSDQARRFAERY